MKIKKVIIVLIVFLLLVGIVFAAEAQEKKYNVALSVKVTAMPCKVKMSFMLKLKDRKLLGN